jgi:hypothetical protein
MLMQVKLDDITTPTNPQVALVKKEELEKTSFDETFLDVNVSQRSCKEELSKIVMHIRVNHSA